MVWVGRRVSHLASSRNWNYSKQHVTHCAQLQCQLAGTISLLINHMTLYIHMTVLTIKPTTCATYTSICLQVTEVHVRGREHSKQL